MRTCTVCGVVFKGKLPHYPYKCCGAVSCRKELRIRGGLKAAETVTRKLREKGVKRACLKCGGEFWAPTRFIRVCQDCKSNLEANTVGAEYWGAVI